MKNNNFIIFLLLMIILVLFVVLVVTYEHKIDELESTIANFSCVTAND